MHRDKIVNIIKKRSPSFIFSREQELAINNCIGVFLVGSHLYGTNTSSSDKDYIGIMIESPEYVLGLKRIDEITFSSNHSDKKNTKDDIDFKIYSLRKFISLAAKNNPNIIEMFFLPERNIIFKTKEWDSIVRNKNLFISFKVRHSYQGYAHSQKHKLINKKQRLEELKEFKRILEDAINKESHLVKDLLPKGKQNEIANAQFKYIKIARTPENSLAVVVDDKMYNEGMDIHKIYDRVKAEVDAYGKRTSDLDKHDYDLKFASHLFRLYDEGLQLLKEGKIDFPCRRNKFLLDVKRGEYDLDYILEQADKMEPLFEMAYASSSLRHSPDHDALSQLQMNLFLDYWKEKGWL